MTVGSTPWDKKGNLEAVFPGGFTADPSGMGNPIVEQNQSTAPSVGSKLGYAIRYAERGWPVFPLHHWLGNGCSCGHLSCSSPAKHPRTRNGVHDATLDVAQIREWWDRWPDANIAVATGERAGIWVLDIDPDKGGRESLDALIEEHGKLPDTPMAMTGGGGEHHVFEFAPGVRNRGGVRPGIDVRGEGGYIVVEPSNHESGNHYAWEASSDPLDGIAAMPAPAWLLTLVLSGPSTPTIATSTHPDPIPEGGRNNALASLAGTLRRQGLGQAAIEAALQAENQARCNPPLDTEEVSTIAWSTSRYQPAYDYGVSGMVDISGLVDHLVPTDRQTGFRLTPASELATHIAPPKWLIKGLLEQGSFALLFGPPAAGKTFLALSMAIAIAAGRDWFRLSTRAQGPVIYLAGEGHAGIGRRLRAHQIHHGAKVPDNLFVSSIAAPMLDPMALMQIQQAIAVIAAEHGAPMLLVVDTLARHLVPGDENSNEDMGRFVTTLDQLRDQLGCAVLVVHHTGHGDKKRGRGASALPGAADFIFSASRDAGGLCKFSAHPDDGGKTKDCEPPAPITYIIQPVPLSLVDEDGETVTSAVVAPIDAPTQTEKKTRSLTGPQQQVYEALLLAIKEEGQPFKAAGARTVASPQGLCVAFHRWRHWAYRKDITEGDADAKRKAFKRAVDALVKASVVLHIDSFFWPADTDDLNAATLVRNQIFQGVE